MPSLILEDFKIGLDRRRMNETSLPGSLVACDNAHITRGGEVEKAEAFLRFVDLPPNTYGLKAVNNGFMVFGSDDITPTVLKSNPPVTYQRLSDTGGSKAWGSFTINGPVVGDTFTSIKVNGTELLPGTSTCPATVADWAGDITDAINSNSAVSGYSAFSKDNIITVYINVIGIAANGYGWAHTKTGTVTVSAIVNFSGGSVATNPNMIDVLSVDLFDGLPYVVADYDDGIVRHFYNSKKVLDMYSGKARAKFSISADPDVVSAIRAKGSFIINAPQAGCSITSILVGAVELLAAPVLFGEDFEQSVADAINQNSNQSGFSAELQAGNKIIITVQIPGSAVNASPVVVSTTGSIAIASQIPMAGGVNAKQITNVQINSVEIMPTNVDWAESDQDTAAAVASSINDNTSVSGYEAFAYGSTVLIRKTTETTAPNGQTFSVIANPGINIIDASTVVSGGNIAPTIIEPGRYARTYKKKMYSLSGPTVNYSEIGVPNNYDSGTGFGFDNLSINTSGAEVLLAIASYFDKMALLSRNNIQIWFMSDNPDENSQVQVLRNTGTIAPQSVVEFGDSDVFYLSESGIRSIRARDTTNAAFVNDVGIAIDQLIQAEILKNSSDAERAIGFLDPRQGRLFMIIGNTVYVFSFFPSSKISAWSTYSPGFDIVGVASVGQTVVCRSRNAMYKIGSSTERVYDSRLVKVITPFMYGDDPSSIKQWSGIDMACQGTWEIYIATDPLRVNEDGAPDEAYFEKIGTVTGTTYAETGGENGHVGLDAISSHIALMLICRTPGYSRVGSVEIHTAEGGEKQ